MGELPLLIAPAQYQIETTTEPPIRRVATVTGRVARGLKELAVFLDMRFATREIGPLSPTIEPSQNKVRDKFF